MHSGRYIDEGTITTNIAHLSAGRFGNMEFPLPSLDEQHEIVRRAQQLFSLADQLEAKLTAARQVVERLTPALLAKGFRGELVPQDPSDEPASVLLERIRAARQAEAAAGKPPRRGRKKAAARPDQLPLDAAPVPADLLSGLLRECGALSERALLAASELEPGRFQRQLALEMAAGKIRNELEGGEPVLMVSCPR
jgi:type I restriction enzyme S subunit